MAKFVFVYSGGTPNETPEAQQASMDAWMGWLNGIGAALITWGDPFARGLTVNTDGSVTEGGSLGATGWSAVEADSIEAAAALAKGCPILSDGGAVDVYEAVAM